jgi:hypothetical protein
MNNTKYFLKMKYNSICNEQNRMLHQKNNKVTEDGLPKRVVMQHGFLSVEFVIGDRCPNEYNTAEIFEN